MATKPLRSTSKRVKSGGNHPSKKRTQRTPVRPGSDTIPGYFARLNPEVRRIAMTLHRMILAVDKDIVPSIRWGNPTYSKKKDVFWVYALTTRYVNFGFFHGAALVRRDPKRRVEGTGKNLRHIKVRTLQDIDGPYFRKLIRLALEMDAQA